MKTLSKIGIILVIFTVIFASACSKSIPTKPNISNFTESTPSSTAESSPAEQQSEPQEATTQQEQDLADTQDDAEEQPEAATQQQQPAQEVDTSDDADATDNSTQPSVGVEPLVILDQVTAFLDEHVMARRIKNKRGVIKRYRRKFKNRAFTMFKVRIKGRKVKWVNKFKLEKLKRKLRQQAAKRFVLLNKVTAVLDVHVAEKRIKNKRGIVKKYRRKYGYAPFTMYRVKIKNRRVLWVNEFRYKKLAKKFNR